MVKKGLIRKNYLIIRKKKYFKPTLKFFIPLIELIKKNTNKKGLKISVYFPQNYELDILRIFDVQFFKKFTFLLPIIEDNGLMNFYKWKKNDVLQLNKYGIPEPVKTKIFQPNIMLIPLLAFDRSKNRLGYGKGYYDKYLNKHNKVSKKILTVGVAFSFQIYKKLPVNNNDFKLDYVITEKGIM